MDLRIEPDPQPSTGEHCPACSRRVDRLAGFCGRCGAALAGPARQGSVVPPAASSAHRCARCGAPRHGSDRYCSACGVDCWALAAGSPASWSTAAAPEPRTVRRGRALAPGAALAGRRLSIGVGLVVAMFLAVNALPGLWAETTDGIVPGRDTSGGTDRPAQALAGATAQGEAPGGSPAVAATIGAGDPTLPSDATAQPSSEPAPPPPSPTPLLAPTPAPPPTPVVLEGDGSAVTAPFDHPGGSVRVLSRATAATDGCVYIGTFGSTDPANLPSDPSLRTAVIFLEASGAGEGWVDLVLPAGQYFMEIESDCSWVVTVSAT